MKKTGCLAGSSRLPDNQVKTLSQDIDVLKRDQISRENNFLPEAAGQETADR